MTRTYSDFGDNPFMFAPPEWRADSMKFVLAVFEALKTQALMDKLSGGDKPYLNGFELRRAVDPKERNGIASYWLERHQTTLNLMQQQGIMDQFRLNIGRYGYGDDQAFQLSALSMSVIANLGKPSDINWWVRTRVMYG